MKFKIHNRANNMYYKLLISYILIVLLSVSVISAVLFKLFSDSSTKDVNKISQLMLSQISDFSDVVYQQSFAVARQMINDKEIISAMNEQARDYTNDYNIALKLTDIKNVYPFIHSLGIYNGIIDNYIDNFNGNTENVDDIKKYVLKDMNKSYYTFFPRKIAYKYNQSIPFKNVVSFVLSPKFITGLPSKGALIINLDGDYIKNTLSTICTEKSDIVFIIDQSGTIISQTNNDMVLKEFSPYQYIQDILKSKYNKGYSVENVNGTKQLITYVKSNNLKWTFVSMRNYYSVLSNIYKLRTILILVALSLIIIGVILSIIFTKNIYDPIKMLIKRISSLEKNDWSFNSEKQNEFEFLSETFSKVIDNEKTLESSFGEIQPILTEAYYGFLLKGEPNQLIESIKNIKDIDNSLVGPYFNIIICKIDSYEKFKYDYSQHDQNLLYFVISNIIEELMEKFYKTSIVSINEDKVVTLIQHNLEGIDKDVFPIITEIQDVLQRFFKLSVSVSIGNMITSKTNIYESYNSANIYIRFKLLYGNNSILNYDKLRDKLNLISKYDCSYEKKLIESIQLNSISKIEKYVHEFVDSLHHVSCDDALLFSNQLPISLIRYFNNSSCLNDQDHVNLTKQVRIISTLETLDDISLYLIDFCHCFVDIISLKNSFKPAIIDEIKNFVELNYCKHDLSLELVADRVHLSAGYLGTLFKNNTNLSFNEFLNNKRMEVAKELLLSSDRPAVEISEQIGIYNNTYFFTLFKKAYGMTPTQFRRKYKI